MKFFMVTTFLMVVMPSVFIGKCEAKNNILDISRMGVFKVAVLRNQKPVVVFFTKTTCSSCKQILNDLESLARANDEDMYLARVDFDRYPELRKEFEITTVPTTRTYYRGQVLSEIEGPLAGGIRAIANNAIKVGQKDKPKY